MSKLLSVSCTLKLPAGAIAPASTPACNVREYTLPKETSRRDYYKKLRETVMLAKVEIGADLTAWRDTVGSLEATKEPTKERREEDDTEGEEQA